ncbi:MAG: methyltransferase cognate corrinoid protein [Clostridiales bacterium]
MSDTILKKLKEAVVNLDQEAALAAAKEALDAKMDPVNSIENGLTAGMNEIVDRFDEGEMFMPQILIAAQAFMGACEILQSGISVEEAAKMSNGRVMFFTVAGDIHDIGKNIVKTMFMANNFEVCDLGRDVAADVVVDKAIEWKADIIAGSALMTTTMPGQRDIVATLVERGIRDDFKVMFGGAPVNQQWCDEIGADAYGDNAADSIEIAKKLVK